MSNANLSPNTAISAEALSLSPEALKMKTLEALESKRKEVDPLSVVLDLHSQ